ncbi:MAG: HdeD family acid-resistance protein, partial [Stackebrandtia sp.]
MNELLARNWGLLVFRGVLGIGFGIMAMIWPDITVMALVFLWGAYAIVDGIAAISMGFAGQGGERWILVATGILGLLAGVVAFAWPGMTAFI